MTAVCIALSLTCAEQEQGNLLTVPRRGDVCLGDRKGGGRALFSPFFFGIVCCVHHLLKNKKQARLAHRTYLQTAYREASSALTFTSSVPRAQEPVPRANSVSAARPASPPGPLPTSLGLPFLQQSPVEAASCWAQASWLQKGKLRHHMQRKDQPGVWKA